MRHNAIRRGEMDTSRFAIAWTGPVREKTVIRPESDPRTPFLDRFRIADYTGVALDVQMWPGAGYDLARYMPETLRVGDTR